MELRIKNLLALLLTLLLAILLGIFTGKAQTVIDQNCCLVEDERSGDILYKPKRDCDLVLYITWDSTDHAGNKRTSAIVGLRGAIVYLNQKRLEIIDKDGYPVTIQYFDRYSLVATKKGGVL